MNSIINKKFYCTKIFLITFFVLIFIELVFKIIAFKSLFGLELIRIFVFTLSASLLLTFLLSFFNEKVVKIAILIISFLSSFYALLQLTFYNLLGNYMSVNASNNDGLARVISQIPEFIRAMKVNFFILFIPFFLLLIFFIKDKKIFKYEKTNCKKIIFFIITILIFEFFTYLSVNLDFFQNKNQIKPNKELYNEPMLLELSLKQFGVVKFFERDVIYMLHHKDTYSLDIDTSRYNENTNNSRVIDDSKLLKLIDNETNPTIKRLHEYFLYKNITSKNEYTGYFKNKNLILIMIEAFDMISINEALTPTLYKIANEGWYFDNYYTPKYSCTTGESEYIAENSIIPSSTVCTPNTYLNNNYSTSIFNLFKNSGYYVSSYHSWNDEFYNRSKLHINMGSKLYMDYDSLKLSKTQGWPLDTEMFNNSYSYYSSKKKYFTFYITSSTHFPYDVDTTVTKKHWDKVNNTNYPMTIKRYLAKAIELDEGLSLLLNKLEASKTLNDTVIVLFGDHHPLKLDLNYLNDYSLVDRYSGFNMNRLPFIIYNSEIDSKIVSKTSSTFDILPTLANLFDLEYDPRYYVGTDIYSKDEGVVIFTNGSWITDKAMYNSITNIYTSLTSENLTQEYIEKINKKVNDEFYVSNKILTLDYFKYRFE